MKNVKMVVAALLALSLIACEGGETVYVEPYHGPELYEFNLIDSFGTNSGVNHIDPLELDPYIDDGLFDIDWYVESHHDYTVLLGLNDRPVMDGAIIIGSEYCRSGLACDELGIFICRYTLDYQMGCGAGIREANRNLAPIDYFIFYEPQDLFLNILVCDAGGDDCESSSLPVWLH